MSASSEMLSRLIARQDEDRTKRDGLNDARAAIIQVAKDERGENADLTEVEDEEFTRLSAEIKDIDDAIAKRDARITELADEEKRAENSNLAFQRAQLAEHQVKVTSESATYERGNNQSYSRDLARAAVDNDARAQDRLRRHAAEVEFEARTNPNRTDGQGGYFVPPLWLMDEYAEYLRAGRTTANLVNNMALPGGQDSISIPKIASGSTAAIQTADAGSVSSTDITDSVATAAVRTIAGQQDIAIQLLEQSPLNFDEIVFTDLVADLNMKTDQQVISGTGLSGQVLGILSVTNGVNTTTFTGTTGTALYKRIASQVNTIHTSRYLPPDTIVMHPRRWAFLLAETDTAGRPLVVPTAQAPQNALGTHAGPASQGFVGTIQGIDVFVDPNVPTNLGASTNEDRVIVFRRSDAYLWEGTLNTRVLPDVLSGNLQVRLQTYRYLAFTAERYPQSISVLQGTGLVAPTFT